MQSHSNLLCVCLCLRLCLCLCVCLAIHQGMLAVFREDIIMDDSTKYEDDPVPEVASQPPIGV